MKDDWGVGRDRSRDTHQEVAAKSEETVYLPQFKKIKKVMRQRPSDTNSFQHLFLNGSLSISLYLSKLLTP